MPNDYRNTPTQGPGAQRPPTRDRSRAYYPDYMELPPELEMAMRQGSNVMIGGAPHWMDSAGQVYTNWDQLPDGGAEDMYGNDPYYGQGWQQDMGASGPQRTESVMPSPHVSMSRWNERRRGGG